MTKQGNRATAAAITADHPTAAKLPDLSIRFPSSIIIPPPTSNPTDSVHMQRFACKSQRPSPPAEAAEAAEEALLKRKYGIAVWFSGYFAVNPTPARSESENVKEAAIVGEITGRSCATAARKSATAVSEIDAAEIINKRDGGSQERWKRRRRMKGRRCDFDSLYSSSREEKKESLSNY